MMILKAYFLKKDSKVSIPESCNSITMEGLHNRQRSTECPIDLHIQHQPINHFPISSPMSLVQIFPKAATINKIKYNFHMHFNTHKLFQGSMTINNRMKHFLIGEMIHRWIIMCIKYKLQSRLNSIKMIFNRKMAIINKSSQLCLVSENLQKILEIFFNFNPNIFFLYI